MTRPLTASGTISHPECFEYVKNGHTCVVRIGHFSGPVQVQMNCPEYIASLNALLHQVLQWAIMCIRKYVFYVKGANLILQKYLWISKMTFA